MGSLAWIATSAATLVSFYGYIPYIIAITRGKARPEATAWFIWAVEYGVMLAALFVKQAAVSTLVLIGAQWCGVLVVFVLAIWRGSTTHQTSQSTRISVLTCLAAWWRQMSRLQRIALAAVIASLVVWWLVQDSLVAVLIALAVETVGIVFVIAKTWRDPASETYHVWLCASVAGALGLIALAVTAQADLLSYLYPAVLVVINMAVVVAKFWRGRVQYSMHRYLHQTRVAIARLVWVLTSS